MCGLLWLDALGVGFKVRFEHHAGFLVPDHVHEPRTAEGTVNHGHGSIGGNSHHLGPRPVVVEIAEISEISR